MDSQRLKQRIVGAIVLVGLGVIFIPMILTGGRDNTSLFGSNIPEQPDNLQELKSMELPARPIGPKPPEIVRIPVHKETSGKTAPAEIKKSASKNIPDTASRTSPSQDSNKQSKKALAWVVQAGSFSKRDNAMKLRDKLRKKNYPAFVELVKSSKGSVYRVRVGPHPTRTLAEQRMQKLRDKMKIYGVVMQHP